MTEKNKQLGKNTADIKQLFSHADIANKEMGIIKEEIVEIKGDVKIIKEHIEWVRSIYTGLKEQFNKVDGRTWSILFTIIIGFLAVIATNIFKDLIMDLIK